MLKALLLTAIVSAPVILTSQTEIAPASTETIPLGGTQTGTTTVPSTEALRLVTFPDPVEVPFDTQGVPVLGGLDPTRTPIRGLGILERVARARRLASERAAQSSSGGPGTLTVTSGTPQPTGPPPSTISASSSSITSTTTTTPPPSGPPSTMSTSSTTSPPSGTSLPENLSSLIPSEVARIISHLRSPISLPQAVHLPPETFRSLTSSPMPNIPSDVLGPSSILPQFSGSSSQQEGSSSSSQQGVTSSSPQQGVTSSSTSLPEDFSSLTPSQVASIPSDAMRSWTSPRLTSLLLGPLPSTPPQSSSSSSQQEVTSSSTQQGVTSSSSQHGESGTPSTGAWEAATSTLGTGAEEEENIEEFAPPTEEWGQTVVVEEEQEEEQGNEEEEEEEEG